MIDLNDFWRNRLCIDVDHHKTYPNGLINYTIILSMELQCGCAIDEIGGILLAECKDHRQANFRN